MRTILLIFWLGLYSISAQEVLRHDGELQLFEEAQIGIFSNLENNASLELNQGLIGFYGNTNQKINGSLPVDFYDMELFNPNGITLNTLATIENNLNFVAGNINSIGTLEAPLLTFNESAFHTGASDQSKAITPIQSLAKSQFVLPLGTTDYYRPIEVAFSETSFDVQSMYKWVGNNDSFQSNYPINQKESSIRTIENQEIWEIENAMGALQVTLHWDNRTTSSETIEDIDNIIVVGWHRVDQEWHNLGNSETTGTRENGTITSFIFDGPDYTAVTFGTITNSNPKFEISSQLISPNGDGIHDALTFENIDEMPNNVLEVFNRYGILVFQLKNYTADFVGYANVDNAITRSKGLASGIYYYILTNKDDGEMFQGFFYLTPINN